MGKRRIGLLDSLLSLGAFAQQGYAWLVGPAIAVGGPLYLLWGSVVVAAAAHGWWVYPFVAVVAIAAVFGLWMLVLHLNSRIRLLSSKDVRIDEERQVVRRIAEQAMNLAAELNELLGEHQSRIPYS